MRATLVFRSRCSTHAHDCLATHALHKSMARRAAHAATKMPRASPHTSFIVTLYRHRVLADGAPWQAGRMQVRMFRRNVRVNLALQGGGAHGAFTWGVLDRLLEDDELEISWVSATSAGAVNAVAVASGLSEGGKTSARATSCAACGRPCTRPAFPICCASIRFSMGSAARRNWRRWRACGRRTNSIRSASIRCAACCPTASTSRSCATARPSSC